MDDTDESQFLHHLAIACHALSDCVKDCNDLKRNIDEHGFSVEQKATELFDVMSTLQNRFTSQHNELESLRAKFVELQSEMKERDEEIVSARRNMSLLYEACTSSVAEIEGMSDIYPSNRSYAVEHSADERIKSIVEQLVMAVKTSQNSNEGSTKELKATVLELQQELQAKDIQISTISSELSYQLRAAESSAKQLSVDLEDARMELQNLEKEVDVLHNQKKDLETQLNELKNMESVASEQHGRIEKLTDELSRKDQGELSEHFGSITCVLFTATQFHVIKNNKKTFVPLVVHTFLCVLQKLKVWCKHSMKKKKSLKSWRIKAFSWSKCCKKKNLP